jgi:hypothetical protein
MFLPLIDKPRYTIIIIQEDFQMSWTYGHRYISNLILIFGWINNFSNEENESSVFISDKIDERSIDNDLS